MKVKILKCSKSTYWYNDEIGNTYDVNIDPEDNQTYIVSDLEPTHYLGISDCEILSVPEHETPKVGTNKEAKEVCDSMVQSQHNLDVIHLRACTKCGGTNIEPTG